MEGAEYCGLRSVPSVPSVSPCLRGNLPLFSSPTRGRETSGFGIMYFFRVPDVTLPRPYPKWMRASRFAGESAFLIASSMVMRSAL